MIMSKRVKQKSLVLKIFSLSKGGHQRFFFFSAKDHQNGLGKVGLGTISLNIPLPCDMLLYFIFYYDR